MVKKKTLITSRTAAGNLTREATDMDHRLQLKTLILKKIVSVQAWGASGRVGCCNICSRNGS